MNISNKYSFVAYIPNRPGALNIAAGIITELEGNINRIHYDRQIDSQTAFFEVTCTEDAYTMINERLSKIGYLRNSLKSLPFLKFSVNLPNRTGALSEFLDIASDAGAYIGSIDFDDTGSFPETVLVSMNLEEEHRAEELLDALKNHYKIDIIDYDTTGTKLDKTVFYVRFAHQLRKYLQNDDEQVLMDFLKDINHTVQELTKLGENPDEIFENYIQCGEFLNSTKKDGFYADIQEIDINHNLTLFCFQMPGGGSIFVFDAPDEIVMIDTGYGIYSEDAKRMFSYYGLDVEKKLKFIIITHGDADHCGAGGAYDVYAYMHPATLEIIKCGNRAWGSRNEKSILEQVYTTMIALFSHWNPPSEEKIRLFPEASTETIKGFPILGRVPIGGLSFDILLSRGGHQFGQLLIFCKEAGLIFTADSLMNFSSFSEERRRYNSIADFLVTSVNVDSDLAREERKGILEIVREYEEDTGKKCLICGGHGTVSVLNEQGRLESYSEPEHYTHS
ncbi:MAG: MBL fold metallo-hydrolase [Methanomicrobium sp.]|nr:MBL fold metallo-hydrolase [Methanomicrobium sp.]